MAKKLTHAEKKYKEEMKKYNSDQRDYKRRKQAVIDADKLLLQEAELSLKYCTERAKLLRAQIALIKKS